METIKPLNNISFSSMFSAFNKAFEDYEMQLNKDELHTMLRRRGLVPELSFGAFENKKLIAFTLNGIGFYNNIKTAYDTGTGTLKEYRGQGLATKIFKHSNIDMLLCKCCKTIRLCDVSYIIFTPNQKTCL